MLSIENVTALFFQFINGIFNFVIILLNITTYILILKICREIAICYKPASRIKITFKFFRIILEISVRDVKYNIIMKYV